MKNILFVCAMEKEALDITEKLELNKINENTYRKENITMLITGIGKQRTAIRTMEYLGKNNKPDLIINIGYAGSTNLKVGEWVNITRSYNYDWNIDREEKYCMKDFGNQMLELLEDNSIQKVACYTSESFVTKTDIKESVAFDMELHSLALICDMYNIPLLSLKKISDNLSLDKYYENIENENLMELTSSLKWVIGDGLF